MVSLCRIGLSWYVWLTVCMTYSTDWYDKQIAATYKLVRRTGWYAIGVGTSQLSWLDSVGVLDAWDEEPLISGNILHWISPSYDAHGFFLHLLWHNKKNDSCFDRIISHITKWVTLDKSFAQQMCSDFCYAFFYVFINSFHLEFDKYVMMT